MSEVHLPHQHSDEGTMRELQESVETVGGFQTVADIFKLLSDSSRVRIFWLLCHCEECVINLSSLMDMSSPAVSHHLNKLQGTKQGSGSKQSTFSYVQSFRRILPPTYHFSGEMSTEAAKN